MPSNPNIVKIDIQALIYNLHQVKRLIRPGTNIMGIVKSDAYGHGLLPVSRALERSGVDFLAVAFVDEAMELKESGIKLPITILCGLLPEDIPITVKQGFIPVVFDSMTARQLDLAGEKGHKKVNVFLKVDTGMGRLGFSYKDMKGILNVISLKNLQVLGILSHLSSADDTDRDYTKKQLERYLSILNTLHSLGVHTPFNTFANSAAVMTDPDLHFDMVRPGIMLYGGLPSPGFRTSTVLKPVMSFYGRVMQVRDLPSHSAISYGRTYITKKNSRIAILSAGYWNGLPRSMSNRGYVIIRDKKAPIIGRICMNLSVCDVTHIPETKEGDQVTFLGHDITSDQMASWAGTISYEVLCSIGKKNKREYIE